MGVVVEFVELGDGSLVELLARELVEELGHLFGEGVFAVVGLDPGRRWDISVLSHKSEDDVHHDLELVLRDVVLLVYHLPGLFHLLTRQHD